MTAVARRWQELDPLLPEPVDPPEGCMAPLLSIGDSGRPSGLDARPPGVRPAVSTQAGQKRGMIVHERAGMLNAI